MKRGLAQDDLSYEADVSRSYLSQPEKGTFYASLNSREACESARRRALRTDRSDKKSAVSLIEASRSERTILSPTSGRAVWVLDLQPSLRASTLSRADQSASRRWPNWTN